MIHHNYFILGKKDDENLFLTEDKTYTTQLSCAVEFLSEEEALELIEAYKENEADEYYTGDFYVGNAVEVRRVEIVIT